MAIDLNLPNTPQDVRLDEGNLFTQFSLIYEALRRISENTEATETPVEPEIPEIPTPEFNGIPIYIQHDAPANPPTKYLWIQTGIGSGGNDWTFWFEDGV